MEFSQLPEVQDYKYTPLKTDEIRLLKIHPGLDEDVVSCSLEHFPLSSDEVILPEYSALSYAWGSDQTQFPVLMNGRQLTVSTNLHAALQEFRASSSWFIPEADRHHKQSYFIWIDALCINQRDPVERAEQVKIMRKIYQQANCLTAWLGPGTSDFEIAASALGRLKTVRKQRSTKQNEASISGAFSASEEEWIAIKNLLQNQYFSRSWVIQEYGLGGIIPFSDKGLKNRVVFCCGPGRIYDLINIGMEAVSLAVTPDSKAPKYPNPWEGIGNGLQVLIHARTMYQNMLLRHQASTPLDAVPPGFQTTFATLLLSQCNTLSSVPNDKVYSILGFAEQLGGNVVKSYITNELIIDYTATPQEVFASSVRSIALATGRLDILGAAYKETPSLIKSSWTPDWTLKTSLPVYSLRYMLYFRHGLDFDCSPDTKCDVGFAHDLSTLTVSGFVLGKLVHVSSPVPQFTSMAGTLKYRFRAIADLLDEHGNIISDNTWDRISEILLMYLPIRFPMIQHFPAAKANWSEQLRDWICNMKEDELENKFLRKRTSMMDTLVQLLDKGLDFNDDTLLLALMNSTSSKPPAGFEDIVVSSNGHIGFTSHRVREGDLLCIILGCGRPMILRPVENHFELISESFVPSVMRGEAIGEWKAGKWDLRDFELY